MSNFRSVNYSVRPSKSVLRRMIIELYQLVGYRIGKNKKMYLGFGSNYFADFQLFQKVFNFKKMISIEKSRDSRKRFHFNKPYQHIEIEFDQSHQSLNRILNDNNINRLIWLDYTCCINDNVLSDLKSIINNAISGDVFIFTLSVESFNSKNQKDEQKYRMEQFVKNIDPDKIPLGFEQVNLNYDKMKRISYEILKNEIEELILNRNRFQNNNRRILKFEQLIHISYNDSLNMLTYGGVLIENSDVSDFNSINFDNLEFVTQDDKIFDIKVPNLTLKEIQALDNIMPDGDLDSLDFEIDNNDFDNFKRIYRYYPRFSEINF